MLPVYDLSMADGQSAYAARLARLKNTASLASDAAKTVAEVIQVVQGEGDAAVVRYMQKWTDPTFDASRIKVSADDLASAHQQVDPALLEAIDTAIAQVTEYQQHVMPQDATQVTIGGAELGMRWSAVDSAGMLVPGGTAVLFSTLIMTAVPAIVAGVPASKIGIAHPPPTRPPGSGDAVKDISPIVLATAHKLGIENVYRIGGAQGVAALAYGTQTVQPVDCIAGPGNVFVQLAKSMVNGACGTDNGFYGPSEIVTIADDSADPNRVAADLIAQAEHDPGKCFLVAWSRGVIDGIIDALLKQLKERGRSEAIENALVNESCAVVCNDEDQAADIANQIACEHLNLAVADTGGWLKRIKHAGEIFIGDQTPVAAGDYYAGPSHCLPTGTTGRFASGISVYTFLKRTGTVCYPSGMPSQAIRHIAAMAEAEGLDGHAASVRVRG